jgi:hypothetical protein
MLKILIDIKVVFQLNTPAIIEVASASRETPALFTLHCFQARRETLTIKIITNWSGYQSPFIEPVMLNIATALPFVLVLGL